MYLIYVRAFSACWLQRAYLTFGFGDYVFHARQVLIGIFDFALGLGLARLVLGYTGGFLEYGAAVFAARGQNFVYPALPYQRIALLAYAGVAENVDYVLQAAARFCLDNIRFRRCGTRGG